MSSDVAPPVEGLRNASKNDSVGVNGGAGDQDRTGRSAANEPAGSDVVSETGPSDGSDTSTPDVSESEAAGGVVIAFPAREQTEPAESPSGGFGLAGAPTGRRVRARLARFNAPWQSPQVSEVLEPLIATHRASHPKADIRALQRAYDAANHWHSGQFRNSSVPDRSSAAPRSPRC